MVEFDKLFAIAPYSLSRREKEEMLGQIIGGLTEFHYDHCPEYRRILDALGVRHGQVRSLIEAPFLPVRLFKEYELRSVDSETVVKTMTSSGTTGQAVSKIYLDREAAAMQSKVLAKIVASSIGSARLPMIILDSSAVVKSRSEFSARAAGIRGFSMFARDQVFALDDEMQLDRAALEQFLAKHAGSPLLLFGFTFMIWKHFFKTLKDLGLRLDLSQGILIHGGGWKALASEAVSPARFKEGLNNVCGLRSQNIRDYYGMVEQTGTIHMECEHGHLHTSVYGDVIIRRHTDFRPVAPGEIGIIQVLSVLPRSYPGHSLLTEDEGLYLGEDDCACGRLGKYFRVIGRLRNAETRGCGDAYASR
jgi:phenylacetate-coenzyme A ligase PaaK-like adenylate-forming protein